MGNFTFKSQGAQTPTAAGSLLQQSAYGQTIPNGYGQTQSPLLAIWAANLRQGGGVKKFKQFKKGITNYVENIDFLLGHGPIMGVLQVMYNGGNFPLDFTTQSFTASAGAGSFEVSDDNFYFVTAVTLVADYSFTVDDYGGQGSSTLSGSYEIPLWNELETGPDPTGPMSYRCWPFCYRWQPGFGATVYIDAQTFPGGTLKVYYAKLTDATSFETPIGKLQLVFEPQLGSGPEYAAAPSPFDEQQIIYPHFAGLGSTQIDLGASGALPQMLPEVRFKWGIYPSGDADFVDMIEDIFKSGLAQSAIAAATSTPPQPAYTQMERGLSSYGLPGTVQRKVDANSSIALGGMLYDMPNTAGNVLVAIAKASGTLAISSTQGDGWAPLFSSAAGWQVWYAIAVGGQNTVTITGAGTPWQASIMEINMGAPAAAFPVPPAPGINYAISPPTVASQTEDGSGSASASIVDGLGVGAIVVSYPTFGVFARGSGTVYFSGFEVPSIIPADAIIGSVILTYDATWDTDGGLALWSHPSGSGTQGAQSVAAGFTGSTVSELATFLSTYALGAEPPTMNYTLENPIDAFASISNLQLTIEWTLSSGGAPVAPGNPIDAVIVTTSTSATIASSVQQGFPGYILAVPFYSGNDGPAGMEIAQWDDLTPPNFYVNTPSAFQAQGRIVRSPGTFTFIPQGTAPSAIALLALKSTVPANTPLPLGDFIDIPSFDLVRAQCRAYGLWGSLSMSSQSAASDWIKTLAAAANAAPVFLGSKLFLYPYAEMSTAGNGCEYTSPTAAGPIAELSDLNGDFVANGTPVLDTVDRIGLPNVLQMQCVDRNTNYNQVTVQQPDAASIALYGVRKGEPVVNNAVQDPSIAHALLGIQVRRNQYGGDSWSFSASARWSLLSPMDLITLTDTLQGIVGVPVRITAFNEQKDHSFAGTAEPFVYGMCSPTGLATTSPTVNPNTIGETAGDVNPPIIFEPVPGLFPSLSGDQIWVVVSSGADNYGGCQVFISTDGGSSYNPAPGIASPSTNVVTGSAVAGDLTGDWPAAADPDSTNNLDVDLTESNGTLLSYSTAAENNFEYPCYVQGQPVAINVNGTAVADPGPLQVNGTTAANLGSIEVDGALVVQPGFGYELMTYAVATLTSANHYTLQATGSGNFLRRAVYGAPDSGEGVDHPAGSRFAFLSPAGTGILKMSMPPQYVGQELLFKVCSFNQFGAALQSLADVAAYSYTPTGVPGAV